MSPAIKLVLAIVGACAFLLALLLAVAAVVTAGTAAEERQLLRSLLDQHLGAVIMLLLIACGFAVAILRALHDWLVLAPARAAEEAGALVNNPGRRLTLQGSRELRTLLESINRLAAERQSHEADIEARIRAANARAEEERNRFATLVGELARGVVVCNQDGRILLYNRRARDLFLPATGMSGPAPLGLGRSIYAVFDRQLIAYALETVCDRSNGQSQTTGSFVAAAGEAGRLLRIEVAPVVDAAAGGTARSAPGDLPAYLLLLDDITATFDSESKRDVLLQDLTQGIRGRLANLRAAAETLHDYPDMKPEEREQFLAVISEEAQALGSRVESAAREFASVLKTRWPLEEMLGVDLLGAARRRIERRVDMPVTVEAAAPELWIKVDGFSLLQALTYLASRLRDERAIRQIRLRLSGDGSMAHIDMIWSGAYMSTETVVQWEVEPMHTAGESTPLTVRDVVERCGGEIWFQRERASQRAYFRLLLPAVPGRAAAAPAAQADAPAPEFYDFDLFRGMDAVGAPDERPLDQLAYTVFDTETTGLDPSGGDEIIQIGAVRIVNCRLLRQERFEQLIDPRRPLRSSSVKIHGITPDTLVDQPSIERVLPVFRAFVADTVLVAHNAAFDMRFLELKEEDTGIRFDRPVLDTYLLSAVVFPNQESHRLEAIAERLGVAVVGRHTALGDAMVTAEVFVRMLPLLADRGIHTLRQAQEAARKAYHAGIRY